eukprot:COSAG01_NODE_2626_length_7353_cov_2.110958_4_plen_117_part_00
MGEADLREHQHVPDPEGEVALLHPAKVEESLDTPLPLPPRTTCLAAALTGRRAVAAVVRVWLAGPASLQQLADLRVALLRRQVLDGAAAAAAVPRQHAHGLVRAVLSREVQRLITH